MGATSFYFYDLETSGFRPRQNRIMQFAGQRTDMDFNPIGQPDNIFIRLTPDVLPDPDAVLVHGISPQLTLKEGQSEADFLKYLTSQVFKPNTIFVGYNNIRFDDEFMRFSLWRNFYDAYEWQWKNGCSRWDVLDVIRMMRALRPAGLEWPVDSDGKASNRLALISRINQLAHDSVHDALSDVNAVIALAKLIKTAQPKLFKYLFNVRDKQKVAALVENGDPVVYTSGRYSSDFNKTTIAVLVARHPDRDAALVYDLRVDPAEVSQLSSAELAAAWQNWDKDAPYFPVKILAYNKCPAVAPLAVLDKAAKQRIQIDLSVARSNLKKLHGLKDFGDKLIATLQIMQPKTQAGLVVDPQKVDEQLYDGFVSSRDKMQMRRVHEVDPAKLSELVPDFDDERLKALLPLYKARNYPEKLTTQQRQQWESFRSMRLTKGGNSSSASRFLRRLAELETRPGLSESDQHLLKDLSSYAQAILPGLGS